MSSLGICITEEYTSISSVDLEHTRVLPTIFGYDKSSEKWYVGNDASERCLAGTGTLVNKIFDLFKNNQTYTISGTEYDASQLLEIYINKLLDEYSNIESICIGFRNLDAKLNDIVFNILLRRGLARDKINITSFSDCILFYLLKLYNDNKLKHSSNPIGFFELSNYVMRYYEVQVIKSSKYNLMMSKIHDLDGMPTDKVNSDSRSAVLLDKTLCKASQRVMQGKYYSTIFLAGDGFENDNFAKEFYIQICNNRAVAKEPYMFSIGASIKAEDMINNYQLSGNWKLLSDARLFSSVFIKVSNNKKSVDMMLANFGDEWYKKQVSETFIVDDVNEIEVFVAPIDQKKINVEKVPLPPIPKRPNKTTRVEVSVSFAESSVMLFDVRDKGFGELVPGTDSNKITEINV